MSGSEMVRQIREKGVGCCDDKRYYRGIGDADLEDNVADMF